MKRILLSITGALALLASAGSSFACGYSSEAWAKALSETALSTNDVLRTNAIAKLRASGQAGLDALLKRHENLLATADPRDPQRARLRAALDAVGGQRDCHASGLFWHTDFEQAKATAVRLGKPILSLRLLGRLDEELSCANSRFFRTTLYANREVADYLRANFVLHWKSVRPVPRITIDMGDGRTLERTLTGNSIHYVLAPDGAVVDALPGLYGANAFLAALKQAERTALDASRLPAAQRPAFLADYHATALDGINQRWSMDVIQANASATTRPRTAKANPQFPPAAMVAMGRAMSKSIVERPVLRALIPQRDALQEAMDDAGWTRIAERHTNVVAFDDRVLKLMRSKHPAGKAGEASFGETIENLRRSIAEDTVRNEYLFRSRIHEWLAAPGKSMAVDELNARVYAELFLTPDSDPWLGLAPLTAFSAVEGGGVAEAGHATKRK